MLELGCAPGRVTQPLVPTVALASHLIDEPDGDRFLGVAVSHLADDGVLVVERYESGWVDTAQPSLTGGASGAAAGATIQNAASRSTLSPYGPSRRAPENVEPGKSNTPSRNVPIATSAKSGGTSMIQ